MLEEKEHLVEDLQKAERQLQKELRQREEDLSRMNKKNKEYKKQIKYFEETILKKDEKLQKLEMYKKNSEIASSVPGNEYDELEGFGLGPSTNMLDANMGLEDIEPEYADRKNADMLDDGMGDTAGLDLGGMDFGLQHQMDDLGEFQGGDDYQEDEEAADQTPEE